MKQIAIVTPWFGRDLKGGAEQQAWQVATRLARRGHTVEVLTTCCRSFQDNWAVNHFEAGLNQEQNLKIRRFSVNSREQHSFARVNGIMLSLLSSELKAGVNPVSAKDAAIFSSENINSNDLLDYLKTQQETYHAFIFIPYLYGLILNGLPIVASKAFLQPCLHKEVYAYLPEVAKIFHATRGLLFISDGEAQLARQLYGPGIVSKSIVVGAGVEVSQYYKKAIDRIKQFKVNEERFVLYLGRRDARKNTNFLVQCYTVFKHTYPNSNLKLVLAGPGSTFFNDYVEGVVDLGLVEEDEKEVLLANCLALFQPSCNESYSRVMMEAWLHGRPVAAHRDCLATAIAVERAQGGWLASTEIEWQELFSKIDCIGDNKLAEYGSSGQRYAQENASWDKIIERYEYALGLAKEPVNMLSYPPSRKLKEIHQLLPNLAYGDAISNHALTIREYLRNSGYKSDIFVRYIDERLNQEAKVFQPNSINNQAGLLYHHSIGSELTAYAIKHPGAKCIIYHNITPAEFFQPYRPEFAKILEQGRTDLKQLAPHFLVSVGDSAYNAAELTASGFQQPGVLPIAVDPKKWDITPDASLMEQLQDGKSNLIFVGRIVPNKRQEHLIEAFAHYLTIDRNARLIIVGSTEINELYSCHITNTIQKLELKDRVLVTGQINDAQLLAFYRTAHLFWSMSEHEGFCVPLIEAMWFDIPILAYKSSAVPETLGEAGLIFTSKDDLQQVAALAKLLVKDKNLRTKVINAQRKRRESFLPPILNNVLDSLVLNIEKAYSEKVNNNIRLDAQPSDLFPLIPELPLPNSISEIKLKDFLKSVLVSDAPPQEMINYCEQDFRRFVYTYGLTRDLSGKCLELGSNPYFTTILLRQFTQLELTLANYFGSHMKDKIIQKVTFKDLQDGKDLSIQLESHHFNIEDDLFPFKDAEFDVVLFCEIIEHLIMDPVAVLKEIKRILKLGGSLILTTPNVSRLENVTKMITGSNIYDPYSGYGPYGRHNREYNKHELYLLLDYVGFTIDSMFTADVHQNNASCYFPASHLESFLRKREYDLGQYIFVKALNTKKAGDKKPAFLYRSYPEDQIE